MHSSDFAKAALYFEKYFELAPIEPLIFPGQYVSLNIGMKRVDKAEEILDRGAKNSPEAEWIKRYGAILVAIKGDGESALALYQFWDSARKDLSFPLLPKLSSFLRDLASI